MSKSAAQIRLEVEVGAAVGQVRRLSNEMKKLQSANMAAGRATKGVTTGWGGMLGSIGAATGALLKYRAIMFGIQTITEATRDAMQKIERFKMQSGEKQLDFSYEMRSLDVMLDKGKAGDEEKKQISKALREAKVTNHAVLVQAATEALSAKYASTSRTSAVNQAVAVMESSGQMRRDPSSQRDLVRGVTQLIDVTGGSEKSREMGVSDADRAKAMLGYMNRFVALSPAANMAAAGRAGIPGVGNLARQGLDLASAGSLVATIGTFSGDPEMRKTSTAGINYMKQLKEKFKTTVPLDQQAGLTPQVMLDLITGTATKEDEAKWGKYRDKVRGQMLGVVNQGDQELDEKLREKGYTGLDDLMRRTGGDEKMIEEVLGSMEGDLKSRAQVRTSLMLLTTGKGDSEIIKQYKEGKKQLGDPIKDHKTMLQEQQRQMERGRSGAGEMDYKAELQEIEQARQEITSDVGRAGAEVKLAEKQVAASNQGVGITGYAADTSRQTANWFLRRGLEAMTYGDPEAADRAAQEYKLMGLSDEEFEAEFNRQFGHLPEGQRDSLRRSYQRRRESQGMVSMTTGGGVDRVMSGMVPGANIGRDAASAILDMRDMMRTQEARRDQPQRVEVTNGRDTIGPSSRQQNDTKG